MTRGEPLAYIHAATKEAASWAVDLMAEAVTIGAQPIKPSPVVIDRLVP
jgi:thymidine phosphorylase